jgi:hypothetical protein
MLVTFLHFGELGCGGSRGIWRGDDVRRRRCCIPKPSSDWDHRRTNAWQKRCVLVIWGDGSQKDPPAANSSVSH